MQRLSRNAQWLIATGLMMALVLAVGVVLTPTASWSKDTDLSGIDGADAALWSANTITTGTSDTTAAFTALGSSKSQSLQFRGVGTAPNYHVYIWTTLDGSNFVQPETGGDLGSFTDQNYHHAAIQVPLSTKLKVHILNNSANSVACDALVGSQ